MNQTAIQQNSIWHNKAASPDRRAEPLWKFFGFWKSLVFTSLLEAPAPGEPQSYATEETSSVE